MMTRHDHKETAERKTANREADGSGTMSRRRKRACCRRRANPSSDGVLLARSTRRVRRTLR
jgi:hypothetical protein